MIIESSLKFLIFECQDSLLTGINCAMGVFFSIMPSQLFFIKNGNFIERLYLSESTKPLITWNSKSNLFDGCVQNKEYPFGVCMSIYGVIFLYYSGIVFLMAQDMTQPN